MIEAACAVVGEHDFTYSRLWMRRKEKAQTTKGTKSHEGILATMCGRFLFHRGHGRQTNLFIPCAVPGFSIIWCAT